MSVDANRSIVFQATDIRCLIEQISVVILLNEKDNHWNDTSPVVLKNKLETLKDELIPIFDKYFGEGVVCCESFEHEVHLRTAFDDELQELAESIEESMELECPHCSSIWTPGTEEFDLQQCFSCGTLADEPIGIVDIKITLKK